MIVSMRVCDLCRLDDGDAKNKAVAYYIPPELNERKDLCRKHEREVRGYGMKTFACDDN